MYEQACSFSSIQWPLDWTKVPVGFCGAQLLVDCTSHMRFRVHPGQQLYYRGDVGGHQLTSQIITDVHGIPIDIVIALGIFFLSLLSSNFLNLLGHNNDGGVYRLTRKKDLERLNVIGLSDRGYSHHMLIRPDDEEMAAKLGLRLDEFSCQQAKHRARVEIFNSFAKQFSYAAEKARESPEYQAFALMTIYHLVTTNLLLK